MTNSMVRPGETPIVSIVIVNYFHPEIIDICLRTLAMTQRIKYEVVVVDNGSDEKTVTALRKHHQEERITTLIESPINNFFSEGNNIGVRHSNPESKYILMLNSDVGFRRPEWLSRVVDWIEGNAKSKPTVWGVLQPTIPAPGPLDIVSVGWSHDSNIEGHARPEGWCCMFRREWWREMSPDFPFHYGFEEMITGAVREGARCGVLFNYAPYLVHREGGSGKSTTIVNKREPDLANWFSGLKIETLDFTLDCPNCPGPIEHNSYMEW